MTPENNLTTKLPNKLSELIDLALSDLKKVEGDPRYKIDMGQWHNYDWHDKLCHVCLAGSVIAKTLKIESTRDYLPSTWFMTEKDMNALIALDNIRNGYIVSALTTMEISFDRERISEMAQRIRLEFSYRVPSYGELGFVPFLERVAAGLREEGL